MSVSIREHRLKTWPESFEAVFSGRKTHEWRRDDRPYEAGDRLLLEEFVPCKTCGGSGRVRDHTDMEDCGCKPPHGRYTGRHAVVYVTFVTRSYEFGGPAGWVVMSIGPTRIEPPTRDPKVDPRPGDKVEGGVEGEKAEVLTIITAPDDHDPKLGPLPHVEVRLDSRWGQRTRSVMSLETWRLMFPAKPTKT